MTPFEAAFWRLPFPACILDQDGGIVAWNPAIARLTGLQDEAGQPLPDMLRPLWQNAMQKPGAPHPALLQGVTYRVHVTALEDSGWLMVLENIAAPEQGKSDMINTVTHELRTPLSAIKGYLELLATVGTLTEQQLHFRRRIDMAVQEMTELMEHLLDVAWIDAGMPLKSDKVNLAGLTQGLANNYELRARAQKVDLRVEVAEVPAVHGDEYRLRQVIGNLISNAVKYSPHGGEVRVRVYAEGGRVVFSIQDHGLGIAPEYQKRVFERFFRVPGQEALRIEGSGLGLAICYDILKKHGETLHLESEAGKGSHFWFSLPAQETRA